MLTLLLPAGRAIAKTWVSAARTASDQGLRPRMIGHFNEPVSRIASHERWAPGKHCGPAALGLSGARRQLGGGRPRGEGRGRSARGARPPGRGPGYAQALDEILPTNKSDLCQLAATQTAGLVVGNLRSSACAALRAARVAMMALIISFACHTVWH